MAKRPTRRETLSLRHLQAGGREGGQPPSNNAEAHSSIREVKEAIEKLFASIGTMKYPTTIPYAGQKATSEVAAEYFIADLLHKLAKNRFEKVAKPAAEQAGILGKESDYEPNETVIVWQSPAFTINVKRGMPSKMLDREKLTECLKEAVGEKRAQDIIEKSSKERKGTTTISVAIK